MCSRDLESLALIIAYVALALAACTTQPASKPIDWGDAPWPPEVPGAPCASTPVFADPALLLGLDVDTTAACRRRKHLWLNVKNIQPPQFGIVPDNDASIAMRSYSTLIKAETKGFVTATYQASQQAGIDFYVAYIDRVPGYDPLRPSRPGYQRSFSPWDRARASQVRHGTSCSTGWLKPPRPNLLDHATSFFVNEDIMHQQGMTVRCRPGSHKGSPTHDGGSSVDAGRGPQARRLGKRAVRRSATLLNRFDLALVRIMVASARLSPMRFSAVYMSKLGNGAVYPVLPVLVLGRMGRSGLPVVLVSICCVAILHSFYPFVKRRVGRARPFQTEPALGSPLAVLDLYSFPSGHVMTLTATLVPIMYVAPESTVPCVVLLASMGWARIATAHHYPSDVGAGALLGGLSSFAMSFGFLQSA